MKTIQLFVLGISIALVIPCTYAQNSLAFQTEMQNQSMEQSGELALSSLNIEEVNTGIDDMVYPITLSEEAGEMANAVYMAGSDDIKRNYLGIYVNPLGFLQWGPMLGAEYTFGKSFVVDASIRLPKLGLLVPIIDSETKVISGIGIGLELKYFFAKPHGGLYLGTFIEHSHTFYADEDEGWDNKVMTLAPTIGYKFMFSSGLFLRTATYLGIAYIYDDNQDEPYYLYDEEDVTGDISFFGMLEFAIGFSF